MSCHTYIKQILLQVLVVQIIHAWQLCNVINKRNHPTNFDICIYQKNDLNSNVHYRGQHGGVMRQTLRPFSKNALLECGNGGGSRVHLRADIWPIMQPELDLKLLLHPRTCSKIRQISPTISPKASLEISLRLKI